LLSRRARAHEALQSWDAAAADWGQAASGNPEGEKLLAEFARRLAAAGQVALAKGQYEKAQALYERLLKADPESDLVAAELAQLLLDKYENENAAQWTVLKPTKMQSEGGATLTLQEDGSILAGDKNPDRDVYTLVARPGLEHITAIRLEALPDPSLPQGGPGRHPGNGNFNLNELRVFSGGQPATLTNMIVVHDERQLFRDAIDGKIDSSIGWSNSPNAGKANTAVVATALQCAPDDDLKVELYFARGPSMQANLGRFRLSVSGSPATLDQEQKRFAAIKLTDPWLKLAAAYALNGRSDEARR
jgi:tetratricopeptide (TPR) repeat protein